MSYQKDVDTIKIKGDRDITLKSLLAIYTDQIEAKLLKKGVKLFNKKLYSEKEIVDILTLMYDTTINYLQKSNQDLDKKI
jgi:hypothetical protein